MFNEVGDKLKSLSRIVCWLGIIASCIYGLYLIFIGLSQESELFLLEGVIFCVLGSLSSWLSSLFIFGFGIIVESAENLAKSANDIVRSTDDIAHNTVQLNYQMEDLQDYPSASSTDQNSDIHNE